MGSRRSVTMRWNVRTWPPRSSSIVRAATRNSSAHLVQMHLAIIEDCLRRRGAHSRYADGADGQQTLKVAHAASRLYLHFGRRTTSHELKVILGRASRTISR